MDFDSEQVAFGFHQDHESYYELQNHYDYLNLFIPIQKRKRDKGNLVVIPWDGLKERCPEESAKFIGAGGASFASVWQKTFVTDDHGIVSVLRFDIGNIGWTPELDVKAELHR